MNSKTNRLGRSTNLLFGYNASWLSDSCGNDALYPVPKKAMQEMEAEAPQEKSMWGFPAISLHDTAESLLDNLLPYRINNPSDGIEEPHLPTGAMLVKDSNSSDAIKKLSQTLGIDLSKPQTGFALARISRTDGQTVHPSNQMGVLIHPNPSSIPEEFGVNPDYQEAMAGLKRLKPRGAAFTPDSINEQDANAYLDFFAQMGTHFVSAITFGDVIFQVFAMPLARFERVRKIYAGQPENLSGPNAILFRQYTTDANTGAYGYVSEYGNLLSFSRSSTLSESIAMKQWHEDIFACNTSIFSPYQDNARVTPDILNAQYTDETAIMTELTSLTLFSEYSRKQIWRRVLTGALLQKYRHAVKPDFVKYCNCNLTEVLRNDELPGFLSTIATPVINTYKPSLDLSDLSFVAGEQVRQFTLYGNYLFNSRAECITIPGDDVVICGQLFSLETKEYTPTIRLADKALDTISISCRTFYGALQIRNMSDTAGWTVVDGLKYASTDKGPDGRSYVSVVGDIRKSPQESIVARIKNSLQFNYAFADAGMATVSAGADTILKEFMENSMSWLTEIIPAETRDIDLMDLRLRALDKLHIAGGISMGAFVPVLPYENYQQQIDLILAYINEIDTTIDRYHTDIEFRKTRELVIDVAKDINKNIIDSGKLLAGYVKASISQQQQLSVYYQAIIKQKQTEQKEGEKAIAQLQGQLDSQHSNVITAVENYKQAIQDWKITEEIKFALTVATDLLSLGTTLAVPASSINAVKDLGIIVQRIQKFFNIINATYKVFTDTKSSIDKLSDAQKTFDGLSETLSADLNWDELSIKLDEVLATGPSDSMVTDKKAALVSAFKIYALKGKALSSVRSNVQQAAREVYNQQRQKDLVDDQANRLAKLDTSLNPATIDDLDKSNIDLIGLTGSLSAIRSQMLGVLAKAFITQDQVLQYTWLQTPTQVPSFDILGIKGALVAQKNTTISAQTALLQYQATTTTPIEIRIEVPVAALKNGGIYQFNLLPTVPEFYQYVDVRIKSVIASIEGIRGTESGRYLLELAYGGRPFFDRAIDRDIAVFNTLRRTRTYEYEVDGNKALFTDNGETWSEGVNPVTPFSVWEISLPGTRTNKALSFDALTATITLSFVLHTRIHDDRIQAKMLLMATNDLTPVKPPLSTLLSQMSGRSVLNNWDVVFNMSLDKIDSILERQYNELKNNDRDYGGKITANTAVPSANIGDIKCFDLQKFDLQYGYPKLQFLVNNDNTGKLDMVITQGTIQKGNRYIGENNDDDHDFLCILARKAGKSKDDVRLQNIDGELKWVLEYNNSPAPLGTKATLAAVIQINQVKGIVNNGTSSDQIFSVVLDMSKGTFSASNIEIDMSDQQVIAFSDAVKSYFAQHPVMFIINSLNMAGITTLNDLKPHQFLFKVLQTHAGNQILQLFIQTANRDAFNYSQTFINSDVTEPIPQDSECSLMISSRIFFGSILPASITTGWQLTGKDPGNASSAWSGSFTVANVQATVNLGSLNHSFTPPSGSPGAIPPTTYYTYEPASGNPVTWSLGGMAISPTRDGQMTLSYNAQNTFFFKEKTDMVMYSLFGSKHYYGSSTQSTDITLTVSSALPAEISGPPMNQQIKVSLLANNVSVAARTSGGGPCGSDDLQAKVNAQLKDGLPPQIVEKLNFGFAGVSVFAIQNLLFPSGNCINLQQVSIPGDLLILGKFTGS